MRITTFFYWNVPYILCGFVVIGSDIVGITIKVYIYFFLCSELAIIKIKEKKLSEWDFTAGFLVKYKIKRLWSYGSYTVKLLMLTFRASLVNDEDFS